LEIGVKRFILLACLLVAGCNETLTIEIGDSPPAAVVVTKPDVTYPAFQEEFPTINLIQALRQENWLGDQNEGSCVHASLIAAFRWQGRDDLADMWRERYENGEYPDGLNEKLDKEGVRYAVTSQENDVAFLEWAIRTRRGCCVTVMGGAHMVLLVGLNAERASVIDNNHPEKIIHMSRESFISEWCNSRSWAVTPVYTPPAPKPYE
jgi:hypothetical protein